jgi:predicted nucleotidyltransferase
MKQISDYVKAVARHFASQLDTLLVEAYQLGSLAHGGFSSIYSDIDIGILLNCAAPPARIDTLIENAKHLDSEYGKQLSVFWGNPGCSWGRLPVLDRLDLLDHGIPLVHNRKAEFSRPGKAKIHRELLNSIERSWKPRLGELRRLTVLDPAQRKPYIRALLYPARLIYSWDCLAVDSNDRAVDYLQKIRPGGLDLKPIALALECRRGRCAAEDVFALQVDLDKQFNKTMAYISGTAAPMI